MLSHSIEPNPLILEYGDLSLLFHNEENKFFYPLKIPFIFLENKEFVSACRQPSAKFYLFEPLYLLSHLG